MLKFRAKFSFLFARKGVKFARKRTKCLNLSGIWLLTCKKALFVLNVCANAFKMAFICLKCFKSLNFQYFSHFLKKNN